MKLSLIFLALVGLACAGRYNDKYAGHKVVRVHPQNEQEKTFLRVLSETMPQLDFWSDAIQRGIDIRVDPQQYALLTKMLESRNMNFEIMIDDLQTLVNNEKRGNRMDWVSYQDYAEIVRWMQDDIAPQYSFVTVTDIGTTFEGQSIYALRINRNPTGNPIGALFESTTHAREWVTPASTTWIINELLTNQDIYGHLLDAFDMHWVVVANPDGYIHTWESDRLWRKNRTPNSGSSCMGTDLNRNWPFQWSVTGSSNNPCSDTFHGPGAGSELETQAIMNYADGIANLQLFQAIHSYSQYLLLPWSYTSSPRPPNYDAIEQWALRAEAAVEASDGQSYLTGNTVDILYAVGGGSFDYFLDLGVEWSTGWELRDQGQFGFLLPESQIIPNARELLAGLQSKMEDICACS